MDPKCYAVQCIVNGEKKTPNCPSPWHFITLPEENQAMAIDNMHRKVGKDRTCGSGEMLTDRQTDTQTHVFTTIPRHHSYWRSNKNMRKMLN